LNARRFGTGLILTIIVVILAVSASYWFRLSEPTLSVASDIGNIPTIVLAGDDNYPPFEYIDENGEYRGFDVDIIKAVSLAAGFEVIFKPMPFAEARTALSNGEVDAMVGITETQSRQILYDFSDPYIMMEQRIFVRTENRYILSLDDLAKARVAVQSGDIANEFLAVVQPMDIVYTHNQEQAFQLLLDGKVDAVVANKLTGQYIVQEMHQEQSIKMVGNSFAPAGYGLAVSNDNTELLDKFNLGLKTIKENGTYDQIFTHWFGETITTSVISQKTVVILVSGLLLLSLLFILVILWNRSLADRVHHRTIDLTKLNTKLAQLNQELIQASNFKKIVLDNVYAGIITMDLEHKVMFVNRHALAILEIEAEDFLEKSIYDIPAFSPLSAEDFFGLPNLDSDFFSQERHVRIGERERRLKLTFSSMFMHDLQRNGLILTFSDITEEWELRHLMQRKDKLQALGQIAAGIAHEIRNPLTAIKGFIQLLPTKVNDSQFNQTLADCLPQEVDRLERIVNDMLDLTRRKTPERKQWELAPVVQSMLSPIIQNPTYSHIRFHNEIPVGLTVYADQDQIRQVLLNIVLNAIAAIKGSGTIILQASNHNSVYSLIEVKDNGSGIAVDDLPKIFDPFFTTKTDGTGLGLAACYQYIQENYGEIKVHSVIGEGTTVAILLPAYQLSE